MLILASLLFAAAANAVPFTLERLELDLAVDYEHERIDGTARLTVRNTSTESARIVPLLLGRLMKVRSAGGLQFEQNIVTFEDESIRQVDAVTVHLAQPLAPGASTTVAIDYGGHIVGYTETGELYVQDRVSEAFTMIREDALAFPVLGAPSRAANRTILRNGFSFDARITVPKGFVVAAGSLVDTHDDNGRTTFHFASSEPAPFLNLSIAKFGILDENGVRVYYLPADEAGAKLILQRTRATLDLFTKWFGPLGKPPRLAVIEIPENWGSQAGLIPGIILTADSFRDPKYLFELYHELGHLWNPPDLDKPSARLNEGLSEWLQWVVAAQLDNVPPDRVAKMQARIIDRVTHEPRLASIPLASFGASDMTDWSYRVGHLYFSLLERVIGRDALLGIVRDYYQANREKGATLKDFTALVEKRCPQASTISADWIYSTRWLEKLRTAGSLEALAAQYLATS
ncbi:MAG TPA: hypothetical protein VF980_15615 [Thermoanaerobaculia bacterium]